MSDPIHEEIELNLRREIHSAARYLRLKQDQDRERFASLIFEARESVFDFAQDAVMHSDTPSTLKESERLKVMEDLAQREGEALIAIDLTRAFHKFKNDGQELSFETEIAEAPASFSRPDPDESTL